MVTTFVPFSEQRVILQNINWQTFEMLLADLGDKRACRLAYDKGTLEIMTPLMPHEHYKRLIEKLIDVLTEELNLNVKSVGSMTCKREDLVRGAELDSAFYIQNEALVREKEEIDLTQDPPPDLMLEVDLSSLSLDKLPIYVALGIPEVWRYYRGVLQICQLREGQYVFCDCSPTFADLPLTEIPLFLEQSTQIGEMAMIRAFRTWVRQQM